jgi:hypothetical protein
VPEVDLASFSAGVRKLTWIWHLSAPRGGHLIVMEVAIIIALMTTRNVIIIINQAAYVPVFEQH